MKVRKVRDLTLIDISYDKVIVIACDSCGAVGMKTGDVIKVSPYYTGTFTARVALMEVISAGAEVVTISNAVCCEMEPTGEEIIKGVKEELIKAGIQEAVLTGSTEENFTTISTGLGITVVGIVDKSKIKINSVDKICALVSIGSPKVGNEINVYGDEAIVSYDDIYKLLDNPHILEIVPVGSKGIFYEAEEIAKNNKYELEICEVDVDLKKSCGPSTVVIAAVDFKGLEKLLIENKKAKLIGQLKAL